MVDLDAYSTKVFNKILQIFKDRGFTIETKYVGKCFSCYVITDFENHAQYMVDADWPNEVNIHIAVKTPQKVYRTVEAISYKIFTSARILATRKELPRRRTTEQALLSNITKIIDKTKGQLLHNFGAYKPFTFSTTSKPGLYVNCRVETIVTVSANMEISSAGVDRPDRDCWFYVCGKIRKKSIVRNDDDDDMPIKRNLIGDQLRLIVKEEDTGLVYYPVRRGRVLASLQLEPNINYRSMTKNDRLLIESAIANFIL